MTLVNQSFPQNLFSIVCSYSCQSIPPPATQMLKTATWKSLLSLPFLASPYPLRQQATSLHSFHFLGPVWSWWPRLLPGLLQQLFHFGFDSSSPFSVRQPEQSLQKGNWSLWVFVHNFLLPSHSFYLRSSSVGVFPQEMLPHLSMSNSLFGLEYAV